LRHFAREIESDLLFRGFDVFDWHSGVMSSRRLLTLILGLADDPNSSYSKARRDGDWSDEMYIWAGLLNEMRYARADAAAMHAGQKMKVSAVKSPRHQKETAEDAVERKEARDLIMGQLTRDVED
jgi:hypothetical protein